MQFFKLKTTPFLVGVMQSDEWLCIRPYSVPKISDKSSGFSNIVCKNFGDNNVSLKSTRV